MEMVGWGTYLALPLPLLLSFLSPFPSLPLLIPSPLPLPPPPWLPLCVVRDSHVDDCGSVTKVKIHTQVIMK